MILSVLEIGVGLFVLAKARWIFPPLGHAIFDRWSVFFLRCAGAGVAIAGVAGVVIAIRV